MQSSSTCAQQLGMVTPDTHVTYKEHGPVIYRPIWKREKFRIAELTDFFS